MELLHCTDYIQPDTSYFMNHGLFFGKRNMFYHERFNNRLFEKDCQYTNKRTSIMNDIEILMNLRNKVHH